MSEEVVNAEDAAAEAAADFIFGKEPEYEPNPEPVEEGAEAEVEEETEEVEAAEEEEVEVETEFVEVEYDGKLYEVPNELKDALMMQSDYTKKTQEVAQQRTEMETQLGAVQNKFKEFEFAESIQEDVMKAQQLEATANQYHEYLRNNIENLSSTDIEKLRLAIEDSRRERDEIVQSVQTKQVEFQQAQEQSFAELLNKGTEVLKSKIPGWGEENQKQVRDYALSTGFTEAEINNVVDPRQVEVLWKASQYDSLQAGKASAVKKVQEAPKTIKPRTRDAQGKFTSKKAKLQKALKSNASDSDKANLIGESIADRFFS